MAEDVSLQTATPATLPADAKSYKTIEVSGKQYFPMILVDASDPTRRAVVGSTGALSVRERRGTKTFTDPAPTTSASVVLAANSGRIAAIIQNVGTVDVYLGSTSGVTTTNGLLLAAGATLVDDGSTDAWYGITASGTADLRVCEVA